MAASKYDATYTPSCTTAHCTYVLGCGGWRVLVSVDEWLAMALLLGAVGFAVIECEFLHLSALVKRMHHAESDISELSKPTVV